MQPAKRKEPVFKKQEILLDEERVVARSPQPVMEPTKPKTKKIMRPPKPMPAAGTKPLPSISSPQEIPRIELALLLKRTDTRDTKRRSYDMAAQTTQVPEKTETGRLRATGVEKYGDVALEDEKTVDSLKEGKVDERGRNIYKMFSLSM